MIAAIIISGLFYLSYKYSQPKKKVDQLGLLRKKYKAKKIKEFENN